MKKILVAIGGFYPAQNYGGPVVSVNNLCSLLCNDYAFDIVTVNHDLKSDIIFQNISDGWNKRDNCEVLYLPERAISFTRLKQIVLERKPDLIYLQSMFLAKFTVPFLCIAKQLGIPLLLAPRGDICENALNGKYKKLPYLLCLRPLMNGKNVWFQATFPDEKTQIQKYIGVPDERIFMLSNVPTVREDILPPSYHKKQEGILRCVFISRLQRVKNLVGALKALSLINDKNIVFDIYGPMEVPEYFDECQRLISNLSKNIDVVYHGPASKEDVPVILRNHDVFFLPSFSENFGHAIVEAMLQYCPVIISDKTPWTDVSKTGSFALPPDDYEGFAEALRKFCDMGNEQFNECRYRVFEYVKSKINMEKYKEMYEQVLLEIFSCSKS